MVWRLFLPLLLLTGGAPEAEISDLRTGTANGMLTASFELTNAVGPVIIDRIHSGLATGFVFQLEIARVRRWRWDNKVAGTELEVLVMYNAVSREYLVNFKHDGKLIESRLARERKQLEAAMTRIEDLPVFPLEGLPRGPSLRLRARARIGSRTILAVIPSDVTTDWSVSPPFDLPAIE